MYELPIINPSFKIPRNEGWEEVMERLVRRITGAVEGKVSAGVKYENELFKMKPHVFGICYCNYGTEYKEFCEKNVHSPQCFHTTWKEINDTFRNHPKYHQVIKLKTECINMERQLCVLNNIPYAGGSIANVCTCLFSRNWKALNIIHEDSCVHVMPNFQFNKIDLKIWWNQKFFRNAYANQEISLEKFREIIKLCVKQTEPMNNLNVNNI